MGLTPEQHAIRLRGITASEIGTVVGADGAFDSPLHIWALKTGLIAPGDETDIPEHIELGNLLEPVVAALYTRRTGNELVESGTLVHPTDPLQIATPDRLVVGKPWVVQIKKCRSRSNAWGREGTDEIPENVMAQVQYELSVTGREVAEIPVLFFGSHLAIYRVKRDDELISGLIRIAHRWWRDHVVARVPPTPDGSERTTETLSKMFTASGKFMPLTPEGVMLAAEYDTARADEKAGKDRKDAIGNQLRLLIGDNDGFVWPNGKATWTQDDAGKPSWKTIAESLGATPELIAQHTKPPGRTLRVQFKEGK